MLPNSMKVYSVYINPAKENPYSDAQFIPEGFNIFAMLFAPIWTLYHRLWVLFTVVIVLEGLAYVGREIWHIPEELLLTFDFAWALVLGLCGNDWRGESLSHKGWIMIDVVTGSSLVAAQQRFFDRHVNALLEAEYRQGDMLLPDPA